MYPFATDSEERILALKDRVMIAGRAFNEVKTYYGEGDDRFDPSSGVEVFGRPTSLEFFGIFKTFVTSWDVSHQAARKYGADICLTDVPRTESHKRRG
jgi:hypothetical protein